MIRLAVISINHNHGDMIQKAVESLIPLIEPYASKVFIINNVKDEKTKTWLASAYPEIALLENSQPKGFASNMNAVMSQNPNFDYYLLVNPDAICLPGMVAQLIEVMEQDSRVGIAGPTLLNMDGTIQPSRRRFATFPFMVIRALHIDSLFRNLKSINAYLMDDVQFDSITSVDWITGALMLLRKQALDEVGLFDERFFMYFEDEDLCCRMWKKGWKVCYVKAAQAYHVHIAEGRKKILSRANIHHITSAVKMFIKYHGNISRCDDE